MFNQNFEEIRAVNGATFTAMLKGGAERLNENRKQVNDLNVFPIPDGDTGDNMLMTFGSGYKAAENAEQSLKDVCLAAKRGMLLGARGNSGVILSRIFAGITGELCDKNEALAGDFKNAINAGVKEAYSAVSNPVEGTILTVYKDAALYAEQKLPPDGGVLQYLNLFTEEMQRSLERTPELLPVLAEAGVVDSGGAGLTHIFLGMRDALLFGDELAATDLSNDKAIANDNRENADDDYRHNELSAHRDLNRSTPDLSLFNENSELKFGYCTEFLLRLQRSKTDIENFDVGVITDFLKTIGDSIVAFKDGSIVKAHVHTKTPGDVLNFCQNYGEFLTLKIENMTLQNDEAIARGDNAQASLAEKQSAAHAPVANAERKHRKKNAIVAVASGEGLKNTFLSLGVDKVIDGGQSMNPSAQDFINAFEQVNANRILVFPNNKNVILAAKQASELYPSSEVVVIETRTLGEGYAAISMLDCDALTQEIIDSARENVESVKTLLVSKANKNTELCGVKVCTGDYIAFIGNEILSDEKTPEAALFSALNKLDLSDFGIMLLFSGDGANANDADALCKQIRQKFNRLELLFNEGGQRVYDYLAVLE